MLRRGRVRPLRIQRGGERYQGTACRTECWAMLRSKRIGDGPRQSLVVMRTMDGVGFGLDNEQAQPKARLVSPPGKAILSPHERSR
jgi:hypothetical protein